jgi:phage N-6-adenine-methyltransferase
VDNLYSKAKPSLQSWQTPPALFKQLDNEFAFTVDAAASAENALCAKYWDEEIDGLAQDWSTERAFCNPPFGKARLWVAKGATAEVAVLLIPAAVDTRWWYEFVLPSVAEIRFIKGRVAFFKDGKQDARGAAAPIGCTLLVWRNGHSKLAPIVTWGYTWPGRPPGWIQSTHL